MAVVEVILSLIVRWLDVAVHIADAHPVLDHVRLEIGDAKLRQYTT